jgi:hypothetical protein
MTINHLLCVGCTTNIYASAAFKAPLTIANFSTEHTTLTGGQAWETCLADLFDPNSYLHGDMKYATIVSSVGMTNDWKQVGGTNFDCMSLNNNGHQFVKSALFSGPLQGNATTATAATNDSAGNNISLFYYPTSNPSAFISSVPVTATNQFLTTNVSLTITPTNGAASGTFTAAGALTLNLPLITNKVYYVSSEIATRVFCTNNVLTNALSVTVPPGMYKYTASFTTICPTNTGFSGYVILQGSDTCYGQETRIKNSTLSYNGGATVYTEGWSGFGKLNAFGVDPGFVIGCAYSSGIINVTAGHTYTAAINQNTIDAVHPIYITNSFMLFEPIIQ